MRTPAVDTLVPSTTMKLGTKWPMTLESSNDARPAALVEFVQAFETCSLPFSRWTHAAHLTVALWYLTQHPRDEATRLIRCGIQRYNAANGRQKAYHETITLAWIEVISRFLVEQGEIRPMDELVERLIGTCGDADYLLRFYSRERLLSDAARAGWIRPDLAEFGSHQPEAPAKSQPVPVQRLARSKRV
jgi:hypothetical protein